EQALSDFLRARAASHRLGIHHGRLRLFVLLLGLFVFLLGLFVFLLRLLLLRRFALRLRLLIVRIGHAGTGQVPAGNRTGAWAGKLREWARTGDGRCVLRLGLTIEDDDKQDGDEDSAAAQTGAGVDHRLVRLLRC